jgi:predicted nucleic acid-binding protein
VIVVSNTSPLTNLAAIGRLQLIERLHGRIHIPQAVFDELHANGRQWPGAAEVAAAPWIVKHRNEAAALGRALSQHLGPGESEAIALAVELKADLVLLDDRDARAAASGLGLRVGGVCGILLRAKAAGEIPSVGPELDRLRGIGFYLTAATRKHVLELAGESA